MTQTANETDRQDHLLAIHERLLKFSRNDTAAPASASVVTRSDLVNRIRFPKPSERSSGIHPYSLSHSDFKDGAESTKQVRRKLDDESDILNSYYGWHGVIEPEYDMLEPYTILDTESMMYRALRRKYDVMFRNGFTFTSLRQNLTEYVEQRSRQIAYVMRMSFENLLKEIIWHLSICSNVFLIKIRDEDASGGKASDRNGDKTPVAGYQIVPAHCMYPFMDGKGRVKHWRRMFGNGLNWKDYSLDDVVHFFWDRKPGHIFGTPRIITVRDDIFALRRIEENAELLLISHMFPFTHIKVGSEEAPCQFLPDGTSEVDMYREYVQNMPKEGVLITDERVEVNITGGGDKGVDSQPLRDHYKRRIYIGFGVSPIDMGESDEATRSSADNVSQNLKDAAKNDLRWFCEQFRYDVIREWFEEAPFKISVQNAVADVNLEFHELDRDSQIAMESHHLNMYNNHAITHDELRHRVKGRQLTDEDEKKTHFSRNVMSIEKHRTNSQKELVKLQFQQDLSRIQAETKAQEKLLKAQEKLTRAQVVLEGAKAKHQAVKNEAPPKPAVKKSGSKKTTTGKSSRANPSKKASPKAKVTATKVQPRNQHGVNLDPHKAKSSLETLEIIHDCLMDAFDNMPAGANWADVSRKALIAVPGISSDLIDRCHSYVSCTRDRDLIFAYLKASLE